MKSVGRSRRTQLDERGFALLPAVLAKTRCDEIAGYYADDAAFARASKWRAILSAGANISISPIRCPRSCNISGLRSIPQLAPLANQWAERLGNNIRYPEQLSDFIARCHRAGQKRPTPLLLKYHAGDFNCLHQDLYGEIVFPFQVTFFLSQRGKDFEGGEFVLAEQRPRQQSRVEALNPNQGDAVVFSVHHRPVRGARGYYRANLRHGVSTVRSGERYTLGIIFHDAK